MKGLRLRHDAPAPAILSYKSASYVLRGPKSAGCVTLHEPCTHAVQRLAWRHFEAAPVAAFAFLGPRTPGECFLVLARPFAFLSSRPLRNREEIRKWRRPKTI